MFVKLFPSQPLLKSALVIRGALQENYLVTQANEYASSTDDLKAVLVGVGNLLHHNGSYEASAHVGVLTEALNKSPFLRGEIAKAGWSFSMPTPEQVGGSDKFVF